MAKDDKTPSKKEITQFLEYVAQLTQEDAMFKKKLGNLLRSITGQTSPQHHEPQAKINISTSPQLKELEQQLHTAQQERDALQQQLAQLNHANKKLEDEKMGLLDLFKRKEQDVSHLQQQLEQLKQQNHQFERNNQQLQQQNHQFERNNQQLHQQLQDTTARLESFSWANSMQSEFEFLRQVQSHHELSKVLLPQGGENLLQLISIASQWNNVLRVWDTLATQVKETKQTLSATEQQILEHSLALFNLTLQSNQATLHYPALGESYNYEIHQKVSGSGGGIEQVLLAGLCNAAGDNVRAAVVVTR